MTVSEYLAEFVSRTDCDAIPGEVIAKAKTCILDTLGCALLGTRSPWRDILDSYLPASGGPEEARVIGLPIKTSAQNAAFANGILSHVDDLDDIVWSIGHPSVAVLPATLALAERESASGKEFLLAFALGFEVACHLSRHINPAHFRKGWHSTATIGIFGAAAGAAKILKLDRERTGWAIGMAACQSGGLRADFGTLTKALHIGKVGQNGAAAALLARAGVDAAAGIFENEAGYLGVYAETADAEAMKSGLGDPWTFLDPGVLFKRYACCSGSHPGIEAVLELKKEHAFGPENLESVRVLTDLGGPDILLFDNPENALQAKFSMPFSIALAIAEGDVTPADFTDEIVKDPSLVSLMGRVSMEVDPELAKQGYFCKSDSTVRLRLKNGEELTKRVRMARGNPEAPFSEAELEEKFLACARGVIPDNAAKKAVALIRNLENASSLDELTCLLSTHR